MCLHLYSALNPSLVPGASNALNMDIPVRDYHRRSGTASLIAGPLFRMLAFVRFRF